MTKPLRLPRFAQASARTFNRDRFLDGTYSAYFGPGHRPDVCGSYYPPTDWRPANSLLIPPRVIWLSVYTDLSVLPDPIHMARGLNDYYQLPNEDYREHLRLVGAYAQAKATLEQLMPGKVWVEIVDWGGWGAPLGADIGDSFNDYIDGVASYLGQSDGFLQFPSPPKSLDAGSFFGVDFLHVWAGDAAAGYAFFGGNGVGLPYYDQRVSGGDSTFGTDGNPYYEGPKGRLTKLCSSFARYASWLYGPDRKWSSPAPGSYAAHAIPYEDFSQTRPPLQDLSNGFFKDASAALSDYGVRFRGATSDIDADSLVSDVADHFGFDPSTGNDL
jgi:hypothetical protein